VSLSTNARILATTLGEDAILTDAATGTQLCHIEGVSSAPLARISWENTDLHFLIRMVN
jgi:hypothetical protein